MIESNVKELLSIIVSRYTGVTKEEAFKSLKKYFEELESYVLTEELSHVHHIIPRCLFYNSKVDVSDLNLTDLDSWESGNLIRLSVSEHIKAHKILWECSGVYKLFSAYNSVSEFNQEYLDSGDKEHFVSERKSVYVRNMTSETAMAKKTATKITKCGNAMGFVRTEEVIDKFRKTLIERDGSVNAHRHTKEVRDNIASKHNGDADWQLHTEEARLKMAKSKAIPIYKLSDKGEILAEYWGCTEACRVEGIPTGSLKARVRYHQLYRGFYWIRVSEYEDFIKGLTSTTIPDGSTLK